MLVLGLMLVVLAVPAMLVVLVGTVAMEMIMT